MRDSSFQFSKPVLKNVEFSLAQDLDSTKEVKLHRHFHRNIIKAEGKDEAIVELTIKIGCDDKSINPPFALSLTIMAGFRWSDQLDQETVDDLLTLNAPALLLGYARPIIANITSNSVGQYDLPFINFADND